MIVHDPWIRLHQRGLTCRAIFVVLTGACLFAWGDQGSGPLLLCACRQQEGTLVDSGQTDTLSVLQKGLCDDANSEDPCPAPRCEAPDPG